MENRYAVPGIQMWRLCGKSSMRRYGRWWKKKLIIFGHFFIASGALVLVSCGGGSDKSEVTFHFSLSPTEAVEFKSGLKAFALQNEYTFVDGSAQTKEARAYINRESERTSQRSPDLVSHGAEIIDVTVEPKNSDLDFFIFAKTSAYDAERVSLTMIYDKNSATERVMADNFSQSQFLRNWKR